MIEDIEKVMQVSDAWDLMGNYDVVMWVDWREEDEAIVRYCEDIIQTGMLSTEYKDADNQIGFEMWIYYNGKAVNVPYKGEDTDRDTTLITLNEILKPTYEIRLWLGSLGGDTLAFVPMKTVEWKELENKFSLEKLGKEFMRIEKDTTMFEMDMTEVFRWVDEYNISKQS